MRADQDPVDSILDVRAKGTVMIADAGSPELSELLEVQGRVMRVGL